MRKAQGKSHPDLMWEAELPGAGGFRWNQEKTNHMFTAFGHLFQHGEAQSKDKGHSPGVYKSQKSPHQGC